MSFSHAGLGLLVSVALAATPSFAISVHRSPTSGQPAAAHRLSQSKRHIARRGVRVRGQQAIQPERVTEIQQALIREHYMTGEANGKWDATTAAAMQKFQADNGWQTKLMPDSRAIKKLGLGPDYSTAINSRSGNFTPPAAVSSIPSSQVAGFDAASGVHQ